MERTNDNLPTCNYTPTSQPLAGPTLLDSTSSSSEWRPRPRMPLRHDMRAILNYPLRGREGEGGEEHPNLPLSVTALLLIPFIPSPLA